MLLHQWCIRGFLLAHSDSDKNNGFGPSLGGCGEQWEKNRPEPVFFPVYSLQFTVYGLLLLFSALNAGNISIYNPDYSR
jgi:hypothetical protein